MRYSAGELPVAGIAGVTLLLSSVLWLAIRIRRRSEQRQAAEDLARYFDLSLDLLCMVGAGGRLRRLNSAWQRALGYPVPNLIGRDLLEFVHPEDRENTRSALSDLSLSGATMRDFVNRFRCRDGSYRWLEWRASAQDSMICAVARDVTERRQLEEERARAAEQLRKARLLESIGRLAGGIAHDFNNLLTVINGYSDMLLGEMRVEDSRRARVEQILKAGERAAGLTAQLLAFSQKQVLQLKALDLNTVIEAEVPKLRLLVGEKIEVLTTLSRNPVRAMADPSQLRQVLASLAANARDAMPGGGKLVIEASCADMSAADVAEFPDAAPGACAVLTVSDTGSGMDRDTVQHLFEPFFSTKERGQRTGLEMAMVYGIVRQSRGWISASSAPGQGSTFRICFPRLAAARAQTVGNGAA
ncbi:MAG: PAS domain S-box protein [Acidobacteria bacterium]|nr:PAS domain S-box protein [Acidobacteriota bacterium]